MRKAQITIFIVLGIVVMIIFGLMFFVRKTTSSVVLERKINKIYGDFLSSTDIKNYITQCLDLTASNGLRIIGLQSGRLYNYQINNGYKIQSFYNVIPFNYSNVMYNVSYGIKAPILNTIDNPPFVRKTVEHKDSPDYPYQGSLNLKPNTDAPFFAYYNSSKTLMNAMLYGLGALCNELGENYFNITGATYTCETVSAKNESAQQYLKQYILENLGKCVNISYASEKKYNITEGNISVLVVIGDEDVFVSLDYPIIIALKGKTPVTRYLDFNLRKKVRLKKLHELALHLIGYRGRLFFNEFPSADADNIFFNIEKDDSVDCRDVIDTATGLDVIYNVPCRKEGINITKIRDYCLNNNHCGFNNRHFNYSDIVILKDTKYLLDGRPYLFAFAVENRKPALDYIDESIALNAVYYNYIQKGTRGKTPLQIYGDPSLTYNIQKRKNQMVEIFPLGIDPDEDELTYDYSIISGNDPKLSNWYKSDSILDYINYTLLNTGIGFNVKGKNVNFPPDSLSVNTHILNISISDNEGLKDWQEVIIRINPSS